VLAKLWRRYRWEQLPMATAAAEKFIAGASDRVAATQQLLDANSLSLDKKLGLGEPQAAPRPRPTKKNLGIDRGSAEWKDLHDQVSRRALKDHPDFTADQVAAWADMKQTVAAASRGAFDGLQRASKLELLDKFDGYGKKAGFPAGFRNGLRGDLAEWLFNPERGSAKSIFKDGQLLKANQEGATIPDYGTTESGVQEWVNQKSDLIDSGDQAAVSAANKYRLAAIREADNLPAGDKYSIDFIRDPGPGTIKKMLEILFGPKDGKPSPIYRVKIGGRWYTEAP
jgi:hypothetical protein